MKSNYLKSIAPVVEETVEVEDEENKEDAVPEKTEDELLDEKRERIESAIHRARHSAVSFLTLSCEAIYEIF